MLQSPVDLSVKSGQNMNSLMNVVSSEIIKHKSDQSLKIKRETTNVSDDEITEFGDDDTSSIFGLSRKEKSLGLLCQKFLRCMGEEAETGNEIHLENIARKIDVEKRRIYDIVNVMEALEAMSKSTKAYYRWQGLLHLPQLMARLKKEAEDEGLPARVEKVERAMCSFTELVRSEKPDGRTKSTLSTETVGTIVNDKNDSGFWGSQEGLNRLPIGTVTVNSTGGATINIRCRSQRNSLSLLCRRFLMVLLSNDTNNRKVSLDVASTVLIKDPNSEDFKPPSRSRCRRLYDIANVLVAMGLIKKVHYLFGTKKIPLFVYSGPEPDPLGLLPKVDPSQLLALTTQTALEIEKEKAKKEKRQKPSTLKRQTSLLDICEIAEKERARIQRQNSDDSVLTNESSCDSNISDETLSTGSGNSQDVPISILKKPVSPNENFPVLVREKPTEEMPRTPASIRYNIACPKPQLGMSASQRQYLVKIGSDFHVSPVPYSRQSLSKPYVMPMSKPTELPPQRRYTAPARYISAPLVPSVGSYESPVVSGADLPFKPVQSSPLLSSGVFGAQLLNPHRSIVSSAVTSLCSGSAFSNFTGVSTSSPTTQGYLTKTASVSTMDSLGFSPEVSSLLKRPFIGSDSLRVLPKKRKAQLAAYPNLFSGEVTNSDSIPRVITEPIELIHPDSSM